MMRIAKKLTNKIFAKKYRKNNASQLGVVVAFGKSRLNKLLSELLSRTHLSLLAAGLGLSITQVHAETLVVTPTV